MGMESYFFRAGSAASTISPADIDAIERSVLPAAARRIRERGQQSARAVYLPEEFGSFPFHLIRA